MADTPETPETPEPLVLDDATLASLDIPELEAEAPETPEVVPDAETPEQPDVPEEPVRESREQQLARELAEQRQLNARLAADLTQRSQPPPQQHNADPWAHLPEAERQTWEKGAPILRQMFGQMLAPLVPVIQKANEANERLALRNARNERGEIKYPDASDYEEAASQMRWQHYQQTGQWQPLELAYLVAKGAGLVRTVPQPVQQAKARTATKRQQAARTAAAGSVTPQQGSAPASRLTPERIQAMSDAEFSKLVERSGVPKLDVQDRRRRA